MTKTKDTYKESISKIHGNLIVSYEEGDRLGNVGDVYFDKKSCGIRGLSISSKLLEPEEKNYIRFKDVLKLGNSVLIITKKSVVVKAPKDIGSSSLRSLKGIAVVTQDGENLGNLADVSVDETSGIIQEIFILGGKKISIDAKKDKIRLGRDMIVVPVAYKANITVHAKRQSEDALSHVVKNAEKVTRRFADSFNEAVNKVTAASKSYSSRGQAKETKKTAKATSKSTTASSKGKVARKKAAKKAPAKKAPAKKRAAKKTPVKKAPAK